MAPKPFSFNLIEFSYCNCYVKNAKNKKISIQKSLKLQPELVKFVCQ